MPAKPKPNDASVERIRLIREIVNMLIAFATRNKLLAAGGGLALTFGVLGFNDTAERKSLMTLPRDVSYQLEELSEDVRDLKGMIRENDSELKGMILKNSDRIDELLLNY